MAAVQLCFLMQLLKHLDTGGTEETVIIKLSEVCVSLPN